MYYVGAVDGLAGMLYMSHVTLAAHLISSGSVQNNSKPTINTGQRSQFIIRNIQFSKIIDSIIIELSKNSLCSFVFLSVAPFSICSDVQFFAKYVQCLVVATYLCEHIFPLVNHNKNIERSQLTDTHLSLIIKVTSTQILNLILIN